MEKYAHVVYAYEMLDRSQALVERLNTHFVTAVQTVTKTVVARFGPADVGAAAAELTGVDADSRALFRHLVAKLEKSAYCPCTVELCEALCTLMLTYDQAANWHLAQAQVKVGQEHDNSVATDGDDGTDGEGGAGPRNRVASEVLRDFERRTHTDSVGQESSGYLRLKLALGRQRVWQDIQRHVSMCLDKFNLASFSLESFLQLLGLVRCLINIGEDFSGKKSDLLENTIRQISINFMANFHRYYC